MSKISIVRGFLPQLENPAVRQAYKQEETERLYRICKEQFSGGRLVQYVPTPDWLCEDIVSRVKMCISLEEEISLTSNIEFLNPLRCSKELWFLADNSEKGDYVNFFYPHVRVEYGNLLEWRPPMKFGLMAINPPYQAPQTIRNEKGITGGGSTLWDKLVAKGINLTKENRIFCSINPSGWRQPTHHLWATMREKQIEYLEIHSDRDGGKVFGMDTRYDWYLLRNAPIRGNTTIKDENGNIVSMSLKDLPFIPNFAFDILRNIIAKDDEPACELLHSYSAYETRKYWMNQSKGKKFQYPCVYMVNSTNEPTFYWSTRNDNGHFGVPKVIFASGRSTGYILDTKGEYGLTQFARGIADSTENLPMIYKALTSEKFAAFRKCLHIAQTEMNKDCFAFFKKDFWRAFL